ncbi:MAG TPA: pirin family protein [Thermoplasmata archaeon]|nr:pirin family protein [Thermoplasmata archaeon]
MATGRVESQPKIRAVAEVLAARPTIEGAGVHLRRAFGGAEVPRLDPFLLLDDFRSENPAEYIAGFPWHPHRGIETVTYMLDGRVEHEDSLGNKGIIGGGDVQWMTSGSGIIHQEMPKVDRHRMGGFQLWVNLPKANKMMDPRYQEVKAGQIPEVEPIRGVRMRIVAGAVDGVRGPVRDVVVEPEYLDVRVDSQTDFVHRVKPGHTAFAYLLEGRASFDEEASDVIDDGHLVVFRDGDAVRVRTRDAPARFLLVSGKPLREPIAWWGPIVMNNRKEIEEAVDEFQNGTFIKHGARTGHRTTA